MILALAEDDQSDEILDDGSVEGLEAGAACVSRLGPSATSVEGSVVRRQDHLSTK